MPVVWSSSRTRRTPELSEVPSLKSEVLSETFAQAYEEMPLLPGGMWSRANELSDAEYIPDPNARPARARPRPTQTNTPISAAEAMERVKRDGLEGHLTFDKDTTAEAVAILTARKRKELYRNQIHARSEGGIGLATQRFLLAAGTSLADPAGMAMNFVPVVSQSRYARWLRGAGGVLGRTGVRAGVGAAEGAAGAAIYEPFLTAAKRSEQADYDMTDSLINVAFGTALGGGIHSIGGASADAYRTLRGIQHPFEKTPIGDAILSAHAVREKAPVTITPELIERGGTKLDEAIDAALGAAAQPVTRAVPHITREVDEIGGHKSIAMANGEKTGEAIAQETGSYLQMKRIDVNEDARGLGIAQEMMIDMSREADRLGVQLVSDRTVTPEQVRVYEALGRRGFDIERNPKAVIDPKTGNLVSVDEPVFKVGRTPDEIAPRRQPNAAEHVAAATDRNREAALRVATDQLTHGDEINVSGLFPGADQSRALPDADTSAERSIEADQQMREGDDALEAIEEAAVLEEQMVAQQARLLGLETTEDIASKNRVELLERWAEAAELAQICLVRGG